MRAALVLLHQILARPGIRIHQRRDIDRPRSFYLGAAISALTLFLLWPLMWAWMARRAR
ncbi:hypothetical protein HRbin22_00621 [Candidatus Thermoflexus japonica]|uniref:Uncharacterized protein n=1 Tax=Candidatus Thermoflexus japonica TaxID=2035417 RepID=A0A2H5Y4Q9_9CHLR|nr:hypothetical protein HRbin22_00621 [Candidatus Thermoflexus japonica]